MIRLASAESADMEEGKCLCALIGGEGVGLLKLSGCFGCGQFEATGSGACPPRFRSLTVAFGGF